jgi:DNA-binding beta-propeller fold protein YncE
MGCCCEAGGVAIVAFAREAKWVALCLAAVLTAIPAQAADPPLSLERTIPLQGVSGRIDHMAFDPGRKRLIVAELGNNSVDVIDVVSGTPVHRISGLREPQGIGYAQRADVILIANAGDGSVRLLKAADFSPVGNISLGDDADNIRIDPRNGNAVIGYGSGGLAVVDPAAGTKLADIHLPAHPEGFQIDPQTGHTYVNIPEVHQIAVADLDARRVVANWPTGNARSNFPMAFDASQSLVASVFRSPPGLLLLDAATGTERQRLPACGDADDVFFDPRRMRIYVSCGAGELAVLERKGADWHESDTVRTASGARTSLFVPDLDRLYVAERAGLMGSDAAIRVYRPAP